MKGTLFDRRRRESETGRSAPGRGWFRGLTALEPAWLDDDEWVPSGDRQLYAYGRLGLRAALEARDLSSGDTALLPAFVSSSVVYPFTDLDVDVDHFRITDSLTLPADHLCERIRAEAPDVVVVVQYLGFGDRQFDRVAEAARDVGAVLVEDCARGLFSRRPGGTLLGATGDVALYSTRKLAAAPFGGLVVDAERSLPAMEEAVSTTTELTAFAKRSCKRLLDVRSNGHADPSITEIDRFGAPLGLPDGVGNRTGPGLLSRLRVARLSPETYARTRRTRYRALRRALADVERVDVLTPPAHAGVCPFGVAVRVSGGHEVRDRLYYRLRDDGLPAERFMWRIAYGAPSIDDYPAATDLRDSMLVFPTTPSLDRALVDPIAETVEEALENG